MLANINLNTVNLIKIFKFQILTNSKKEKNLEKFIIFIFNKNNLLTYNQLLLKKDKLENEPELIINPNKPSSHIPTIDFGK